MNEYAEREWRKVGANIIVKNDMDIVTNPTMDHSGLVLEKQKDYNKYYYDVSILN